MKSISKDFIILIIFLWLINFSNVKNSFGSIFKINKSLEEAISEYRQENFEEALELFKELYKKNPNSSVINYYLGLCYKEVGNYKKAFTHFKKAIKLKPPVKEAYIEIAYILYNWNKLDEALEYLKKAEKEKVNLKTVYYLENKILMEQRRYRDQREVLEKLKKLFPEEVLKIELQMGISYLKEREFEKAKNIFKNIIKKSPQSKEAKVAKMFLSQFENFYKNWKYFSGSISLGSIYDTNVVAKPSETIGLPAVDEISKKSDLSVSSSIVLNYNSFPKKEVRFIGGIFFNNQQHFSIKNYSFISTGAHFDTIWSSIRYPISYGIKFLGNYFWLDKEKYMGNLGINSFINWRVSEKTLLKISLNLTKRDILKYPIGAIPEDDRDGNVYILGIDIKRQVFSPKFYLTFGLAGEKQDTEGDNWDSNAFSTSLKGEFFLSKNAFFNFSTQYKALRFIHENIYSGKNIPGFPSEPTKRKDNIFTFNIGFNAKIKHFVFQVFNTYIINSSNFKIYDYRRNITGVVMGYAF